MKNVLVIDDDERIRDLYLKLLVPAGYSVRVAENAQIAADILIRESIDLVLLDIRMPRIDGRTMYDIIREHDPGLKVIVSSVYPIDQQRQCLPRAAAYFDKSQGATQLLQKVQDVLALV